jgi:hypothetical protein
MLPEEAASVACGRCGRGLEGLDPDEDLAGDAGGPICGDCARERDFIDFEVAIQEASHDDEVDV